VGGGLLAGDHPEQWRRFEGHMLEVFTALGMPAGTVSTADIPRRFLRAIFDATSGDEGTRSW
jgi:GTP cyclohydrolase I